MLTMRNLNLISFQSWTYLLLSPHENSHVPKEPNGTFCECNTKKPNIKLIRVALFNYDLQIKN